MAPASRTVASASRPRPCRRRLAVPMPSPQGLNVGVGGSVGRPASERRRPCPGERKVAPAKRSRADGVRTSRPGPPSRRQAGPRGVVGPAHALAVRSVHVGEATCRRQTPRTGRPRQRVWLPSPFGLKAPVPASARQTAGPWLIARREARPGRSRSPSRRACGPHRPRCRRRAVRPHRAGSSCRAAASPGRPVPGPGSGPHRRRGPRRRPQATRRPERRRRSGRVSRRVAPPVTSWVWRSSLPTIERWNGGLFTHPDPSRR